MCELYLKKFKKNQQRFTEVKGPMLGRTAGGLHTGAELCMVPLPLHYVFCAVALGGGV